MCACGFFSFSYNSENSLNSSKNFHSRISIINYVEALFVQFRWHGFHVRKQDFTHKDLAQKLPPAGLRVHEFVRRLLRSQQDSVSYESNRFRFVGASPKCELYLGRVTHGNSYLYGQVRDDGICYIAAGGTRQVPQELQFYKS
ncbi:Hypothetical predicted protein [Cloeon dipterum]|uniref:Uncharacterized protein n=1 Tax=Cloeon dipterum TaxID=197152 RepID=A0A8S1DUL3_9INSE|nr:Hypothetical predicted protein [Cloeon dipterum]